LGLSLQRSRELFDADVDASERVEQKHDCELGLRQAVLAREKRAGLKHRKRRKDAFRQSAARTERIHQIDKHAGWQRVARLYVARS
jgi:hypothetical protein